MKVRIGIGPGRLPLEVSGFDDLLLAMEKQGFDSLWLSEVLSGNGLDPLVGLSYAAARSPLKLGTTMLLPGRHLVRLAKALTSVDLLSGGRLLVTFVPGLLRSPEREVIGVPPKERGAVIDEALPLLRQLLRGERTVHDGRFGNFDLTLSPLPVQQPLEFWLGGSAPAALERCGRLGDGWLPSASTPEEVAAGRIVIEQAADLADREISPEHFGVSIAYLEGPPSEAEREQMEQRARGRDARRIVPVGLPAVRELLEQYLEVGFSKFVLRPLFDVTSWEETLGRLNESVGSLQT